LNQRSSVRNNGSRTHYTNLHYACQDDRTFHLKPVPPGKTRKELYCDDCPSLELCLFSKRRKARSPNPLVPPCQANDWITMEDAMIVGDIGRSGLFNVIYSGQFQWFARRADKAGRLFGYHLRAYEVMARWGCNVTDEQLDMMIEKVGENNQCQEP